MNEHRRRLASPARTLPCLRRRNFGASFTSFIQASPRGIRGARLLTMVKMEGFETCCAAVEDDQADETAVLWVVVRTLRNQMVLNRFLGTALRQHFKRGARAVAGRGALSGACSRRSLGGRFEKGGGSFGDGASMKTNNIYHPGGSVRLRSAVVMGTRLVLMPTLSTTAPLSISLKLAYDRRLPIFRRENLWCRGNSFAPWQKYFGGVERRAGLEAAN